MIQIMSYNHSLMPSALTPHVRLLDDVPSDGKISYVPSSNPDMASHSGNQVEYSSDSKFTKPQHVPSAPGVLACSICKADIQDSDILCGRDKASHSHVGNKRFLSIIKMNREAYQNSPSREAKTRISSQIVAMIRKANGRFLKYSEATGEWEPQDDNVAREKVAHALRSCKDPARPKIQKPRRAVKKSQYTKRENELFEMALASQRRIYQELLATHVEGDDDINDEDDDTSRNSGESSSSAPSSSSSSFVSWWEEDPIDIYAADIDIDIDSLNIIIDL
jgi:hypothetical protein